MGCSITRMGTERETINPHIKTVGINRIAKLIKH